MKIKVDLSADRKQIQYYACYIESGGYLIIENGYINLHGAKIRLNEFDYIDYNSNAVLITDIDMHRNYDELIITYDESNIEVIPVDMVDTFSSVLAKVVNNKTRILM